MYGVHELMQAAGQLTIFLLLSNAYAMQDWFYENENFLMFEKYVLKATLEMTWRGLFSFKRVGNIHGCVSFNHSVCFKHLIVKIHSESG